MSILTLPVQAFHHAEDLMSRGAHAVRARIESTNTRIQVVVTSVPATVPVLESWESLDQFVARGTVVATREQAIAQLSSAAVLSRAPEHLNDGRAVVFEVALMNDDETGDISGYILVGRLPV